MAHLSPRYDNMLIRVGAAGESFRAAPAFAFSTVQARGGAESFLWFVQKTFGFRLATFKILAAIAILFLSGRGPRRGVAGVD